MSFTNTWNEAVPLGSAAANTADDNFRALKLDVRERLNSLMGVAIGTALADPIIDSTKTNEQLRTDLDGLTNISARTQYYLGATAFRNPNDTVNTYVRDVTGGGRMTITAGGTTNFGLLWPLYLPVGVAFLDVSFIGYKSSGTPWIDVTLYKKPISSTTNSTAVKILSAFVLLDSASAILQTIGTFSEAVADEYAYYVSIQCNNTFASPMVVAFDGISVTYDSTALQRL